jgi:hypothetical protein
MVVMLKRYRVNLFFFLLLDGSRILNGEVRGEPVNQELLDTEVMVLPELSILGFVFSFVRDGIG